MSICKLETVALRKEYPGTVALNDVSIRFEEGMVHALLGRNGAGKSTLVKILAGAIQPTSGKILLDGAEVSFHSPRDAFDKGIVTVHQELSLVPDLSVAENILLGRLPRKPGYGGLMVDWERTGDRAEAVLRSMEVRMDVRRKARTFSVADQQVIEIAKAMSYEPSVLLLDEPTSALAHHETEVFFKLVRQLAAGGVTILYISHRLHELKHIADDITVLRDGNYVGRITLAESTPEKIVRMLFGEDIPLHRPADLACEESPVLEARNITLKNRLFGVSFRLRKGEILGIAGMQGSGRTELLKAIFGAEPFDGGELVVGGKTIPFPTPVLMKKMGLAFTPEDRKGEALVALLSTRQNLCLAAMDRISANGIISRTKEEPFVRKQVSSLGIKVADSEQPVSSLSGGNQQKVVVGNWLNNKPGIMLFDEPTRGIDIQAKRQIFGIMWQLSREGISSIFVSSELEELLEVCHRILIMKAGRVVGEVTPGTTDFKQLLEKCIED